jgi:hypothetical protein
MRGEAAPGSGFFVTDEKRKAAPGSGLFPER